MRVVVWSCWDWLICAVGGVVVWGVGLCVCGVGRVGRCFGYFFWGGLGCRCGVWLVWCVWIRFVVYVGVWWVVCRWGWGCGLAVRVVGLWVGGSGATLFVGSVAACVCWFGGVSFLRGVVGFMWV